MAPTLDNKKFKMQNPCDSLTMDKLRVD